jgi:AraC-like DNA-binding protein
MPRQPGRYERIVDRALRVTRKRTEEPIRIAKICRAAGVSARTLLRAFRAVHSAAPYRYLQSLRLLEAHRIFVVADRQAADRDRGRSPLRLRRAWSILGRLSIRLRRIPVGNAASVVPMST